LTRKRASTVPVRAHGVKNRFPGRLRTAYDLCARGSGHLDKGKKLATERELSRFLEEAERRAYKTALFAVRNETIALDIVQDAMLKLAEKYAKKPAEEFPMLFQRILQNTIRDHFRRQKVRSTWTSLFSSFGADEDGEENDPLETLEVEDGPFDAVQPAVALERSQIREFIEEGIQALPARQREAFLLRYWEELDVAETAAVMGCSEGSVKTHCSRATHTLAVFLRKKGIEL
jgi:RNA polymerase sigma-70 factor (ECF subfamily)